MATIVITGGQYGSEGKGVIAHRFAPAAHTAIRVGGSNAGHSIIHDDKVWKMRMIPVAWTNPRTQLVLGPGAVIDPEVLDDEVNLLESHGYSIRDRLWIDRRATVQIPSDSEYELADGMTGRIGSTSKGIGSARIRRLWRNDHHWTRPEDANLPGWVIDTTLVYRHTAELEDFPWVLIEGTQGYGLSLTHGPWPYATSADLTVAAILNDCQLAPSIPMLSIMVFRSYPIRVAGNSGPMFSELTWDQMAQRVPGLIPETTTVTGKIRRIGEFDWDLAREAVRVNRPNMLALSFADYIDPACAGVDRWDQLTMPVRMFIEQMEQNLGVHVGVVSTGGPKWSVALHSADPFGIGGGAR